MGTGAATIYPAGDQTAEDVQQGPRQGVLFFTHLALAQGLTESEKLSASRSQLALIVGRVRRWGLRFRIVLLELRQLLP